MTEVITQLPLVDRMRIATAKCYNKKIKENPEFYEAEKKRVQAYIKNRYANDPEYKERVLRQKRESYLRKKEEKKLKEIV
jgi:pyrroloquinoline quinone (PQQ) biosynthesis protein C